MPLIKYSDVEKSINGYGRVINYSAKTKDITPEISCIIDVQEGKFRNGLLDGYGRRFIGEANTAEVGFFKEGEANGKYQMFTMADSKCIKEGIYEGEECIKEIPIANY